MSRKYEFVNIRHSSNPDLFRIRALRDIPSIGVKAGDFGGFTERGDNLSQEGDCWISDNACVYGDTYISGNAHIFQNAQVCGNAQVYDNAQVFGNAKVYDRSRIFGDAKIYGNAQVFSNSWVSGDLEINEFMKLSGAIHGMRCGGSSTQIYYADGVTAYFDIDKELVVNGTSPDIEYHKTLARLKLS